MSVVDLVTAGEAFEDLIFIGLPRLPLPGEEVKTSAFLQTVGGGAIITAVAVSRLGLQCSVISGLSPAAADLLREERVATIDLRRPAEPHAITAALSTSRDRSFVTFNGINDRLEPRMYTALKDVQARHVHFAFYPHHCARWSLAVHRLRRRGVTSSWDFGWNEGLIKDPDFLPLVSSLDYVFMNEQEATLYAGVRRLPQAVAFWKRRVRTAIIKQGARGSVWLDQNLECDEPAPAVETVDTTGAGDAFNGGFLFARLNGQSPRECLRIGNRVGAQSTRAAGGIDGLPLRRRVK